MNPALLLVLAATAVPSASAIQASIEARRKGDVRVEVTAAGRPVPGARVEIRPGPATQVEVAR